MSDDDFDAYWYGYLDAVRGYGIPQWDLIFSAEPNYMADDTAMLAALNVD